MMSHSCAHPPVPTQPLCHLSPATWLWTAPHLCPPSHCRQPLKPFPCVSGSPSQHCALGTSHPILVHFHGQPLPWALLIPPPPSLNMSTPIFTSIPSSHSHPSKGWLRRGRARTELAWKDELLLVFVVVGCLQEKENINCITDT